MANPIEWKEPDRTETKTIPGASARLVVRRTRAPGSHPDGTPRAVCRVDDATTADLASALDALPAGERSMVLKAFGADPEMRAALLADCAVAHGRAAVSEAVANETRKARVAAEAERDEARRHLCNERNGAAGLRDALATMRKERDEARAQCAQIAAERDARTNEANALALQLIGTKLARDLFEGQRNTARNATEQAEAAAADARAERDLLRTELRAREWLDAKGCASRPVFVRDDGSPFVYASYAGAARALGWEG